MPLGTVKSFDAEKGIATISPDYDPSASIPTLAPYEIQTPGNIVKIGQKVIFNLSMLNGKPVAFRVRDGSYSHEP